jgi:EEF1A lysine methyltransferase 1
MSCPTAFVAFQHTNPLPGARLFEFDQRFHVLSPSKYVFYDLNEPDKFPSNFRGTVDVVIADPPFLNEVSGETT